jgi:tetratricopeptide (TPR) repeat protein
MLDSIRMCFFHIFKAILAQKAHPLSLSITFYSVLSRAETPDWRTLTACSPITTAHSSKDAYPKAKEAAIKALELDDELAEAHTSLSYVKMFYYHDWQGAQDGYRRAIALNPNYATAHHWYSEYLTAIERFDEAFVEIRRAKEIDPLSPSVNAQEVWILFYARRYDEAIERGRRIAEMNPEFAEIHDPLKRCYDRKGMYREAIAARQTRRQMVGLDATETAALKSAASTSDAAV